MLHADCEMTVNSREFPFTLNVQVKNAGFYAFLLQKTTCDQKPAVGRGASLTFLGAEDIKRTGVENLAGGSIPPTPPSVNSQND